MPLHNLVWASGTLSALRLPAFPASAAVNCTLGTNIRKQNLEGNKPQRFGARHFGKQTPTPAPPQPQVYKSAALCAGQGRGCQLAPTFALEVVWGCGEQQPVHHGFGAAAAGDPGLLVARLHPLGEPAQVAVTVQGVGAQSPRGAKQLARVSWQREQTALVSPRHPGLFYIATGMVYLPTWQSILTNWDSSINDT